MYLVIWVEGKKGKIGYSKFYSLKHIFDVVYTNHERPKTDGL